MEISNNYINEIKKILKNARQKAYTAINSAMVEAYWKIGRRIVEEEQNGEKRAENTWSIRTLDRNISTLYYNRIVASIDKKTVEDEMKEKTKNLQAEEFIKNPVVLEFLDLPTNISYTESQLEKALTDDIQKFMMELGKGFAFVERQKMLFEINNEVGY